MSCGGVDDSGCAGDDFDGGESGGASSVASDDGDDNMWVRPREAPPSCDAKWVRHAEPPLLSDFLCSEDEFDFDPDEATAETSEGYVYVTRHKETGQECVLKRFSKNRSADTPKRVEREAMALIKCAHPLVLQLVGFGMSPFPFMVTRLMEFGNLEAMLHFEFNPEEEAAEGWDATAKSKCVFGIAAGMAFLHSKNIIHRDLTTRSILLDVNFEPVISCFCGVTDYNSKSDSFVQPEYMPEYSAPEVFLNDRHSQKSDVYAFGILLYQLFDVPRPDERLDHGYFNGTFFDLINRFFVKERYTRSKNISDFYWDLICKCWRPDPRDRPSFVEIVEHLRSHTSEYAIDGSDISLVRAYEKLALESISDVLAAES